MIICKNSVHHGNLRYESAALYAFPLRGRCPSSQTGADEVEVTASERTWCKRRGEHLIRHGACVRRAVPPSPQGEGQEAARDFLRTGKQKAECGLLRTPHSKLYTDSYPMGFLDCQAQVSRHMSSRVYSAFQPRSSALLSGLEYTVASSPGRRSTIS